MNASLSTTFRHWKHSFALCSRDYRRIKVLNDKILKIHCNRGIFTIVPWSNADMVFLCNSWRKISYMKSTFIINRFSSSFLVNKRMFSSSAIKYVNDNSNGGHEDTSNCNKNSKKVEQDQEVSKILDDIRKDFEGNTDSNSSSEIETEKKVKSQENSLGNDGTLIANKMNDAKNKDIPLSLRDKYKLYSEEDAETILASDEITEVDLSKDDVIEEQDEYWLYQDKKEEFANVSFKRGVRGVYDIDEFVDILRDEKVMDLAVIKVPKYFHYTDYLVLATAKSKRHLKAVAEFLRKLYKKKKLASDPYIDIDGVNSMDWKVLDMGNIVFHIFLKETRTYYNIETLWTVGPEHDDNTHKVDPFVDLIEQHTAFLQSVNPSRPKRVVSEDSQNQ